MAPLRDPARCVGCRHPPRCNHDSLVACYNLEGSLCPVAGCGIKLSSQGILRDDALRAAIWSLPGADSLGACWLRGDAEVRVNPPKASKFKRDASTSYPSKRQRMDGRIKVADAGAASSSEAAGCGEGALSGRTSAAEEAIIQTPSKRGGCQINESGREEEPPVLMQATIRGNMLGLDDEATGLNELSAEGYGDMADDMDMALLARNTPTPPCMLVDDAPEPASDGMQPLTASLFMPIHESTAHAPATSASAASALPTNMPAKNANDDNSSAESAYMAATSSSFVPNASAPAASTHVNVAAAPLPLTSYPTLVRKLVAPEEALAIRERYFQNMPCVRPPTAKAAKAPAQSDSTLAKTAKAPAQSDSIMRFINDVELIVDVCRAESDPSDVKYLIKWKGWRSQYNTWEPLGRLQNFAKEIAAFEASRAGSAPAVAPPVVGHVAATVVAPNPPLRVCAGAVGGETSGVPTPLLAVCVGGTNAVVARATPEPACRSVTATVTLNPHPPNVTSTPATMPDGGACGVQLQQLAEQMKVPDSAGLQTWAAARAATVAKRPTSDEVREPLERTDADAADGLLRQSSVAHLEMRERQMLAEVPAEVPVQMSAQMPAQPPAQLPGQVEDWVCRMQHTRDVRKERWGVIETPRKKPPKPKEPPAKQLTSKRQAAVAVAVAVTHLQKAILPPRMSMIPPVAALAAAVAAAHRDVPADAHAPSGSATKGHGPRLVGMGNGTANGNESNARAPVGRMSRTPDGMYRAEVHRDGTVMYLGIYTSAEEAATCLKGFVETLGVSLDV